MRRFALSALVALLTVFTLRVERARAAPDAGVNACVPTSDEEPQGIDPAYLVNSDPSSINDVTGTCPGSTSQRSPDCYLSASWVPAPLASKNGVLGSFWTNAHCTPAMAFHVKDAKLNGAQGVVIAGASSATAMRIREALGHDPSGTLNWSAAVADATVPHETAAPPDEATCLVSFDFALPPSKAVQISSAAIATFYVHWCPSGACGTLDDGGKKWPPDGLGVARSQCIEGWNTRLPVLSNKARPIQRFGFSRGVLYGDDLSSFGSGCAASQAVDAELADVGAFDPTGGAPRWVKTQQCRDPNGPSPPTETPPDFRLVPPALDAALRAHSVTSSQGVRNVPGRLLEGVPNGLLSDVDAAAASVTANSRNQLRTSYLLRTRGELSLSAADGKTWVVVPELLGALDQHLVFSRPSASSSFVVAPLRPLSAPSFGSADSFKRRLVTQTFAVEANAELVVEALESVDFANPMWPPIADAFDVSNTYGTRWTSNAGSPDCFATSGFTSPGDHRQRFSYPVGAIGTSDIAEEMCPNTLNEWLGRTRTAREQPDTGICKAAAEATDPKKQLKSVVQAIAECATNNDCPDAGRADASACLRSGCDPTVPSTCVANRACAEILNHLTAPRECEQKCVANKFIVHTETILPPAEHWADVIDGDTLRLIPMVGLLRTTTGEDDDSVRDAGAKKSLATMISEMTENDDFTGGAHQTLDWNWVIDPSAPGAIDPAYRGIAVRSGRFVGIENEIETGIAAGAWTEHVHLPASETSKAPGPIQEFNTHGLPFASFLESKDDAERLGEIWPSDFCRLFGIDRGHGPGQANHPSLPGKSCSTCLSCKGDLPDGGVSGCAFSHSYWRTHLGRGLFSPITPETTEQEEETASMAMDPAWPACEAKPRAKEAVQTVPLGLEDWKQCPHRVSFLGRPIVDCGHGDECDGPSRLEIHPPHVVAMDVHRMSIPGASGATCALADPCGATAATDDCVSGTVTAVFGWANVVTGHHLEFDLWPPARPTADSTLCVVGHENDESPDRNGASTQATPVTDLGFTVEQDRQHGQDGQACPLPDVDVARLSCNPAPSARPNHVHCVYDDPAAEGAPDCTTSTAASDPKWTFGNPRMTPWFVTSRFEARFFMGWITGQTSCPVCRKGAGSCADVLPSVN